MAASQVGFFGCMRERLLLRFKGGWCLFQNSIAMQPSVRFSFGANVSYSVPRNSTSSRRPCMCRVLDRARIIHGSSRVVVYKYGLRFGVMCETAGGNLFEALWFTWCWVGFSIREAYVVVPSLLGTQVCNPGIRDRSRYNSSPQRPSRRSVHASS